jgi:hypothetical protein
MLAWAFSCKTAEEVGSLVRALGKHRYVREVDHRIHWMVDAALSDLPEFAPHAEAFADRRQFDDQLDGSSYEPTLWRSATADDVAAALAGFWSAEPQARARRAALAALVIAEGLDYPQHAPFEGDPETPDHPLLIQLSWTLHPIVDLDAERHAGALAAMEAAGEEVDPSEPIEHEGPDLGVAELCDGAPRGVLVSEFLVWADGPRSYSDYVFRGASKMAKLPDPPESPDPLHEPEWTERSEVQGGPRAPPKEGALKKRDPNSTRERARKQAAITSIEVSAIGRDFVPADDLYHFLLTVPWWRFFVSSAATYVVINAIFAGFYSISPGCVSGAQSYKDLFFFSVQTMSTIGYGTMGPANLYAHILVTLEAITGMFAVAMLTGITFAKFSRPTARVLFAAHPVIGNRNGKPHLMFRMANWRHNQILDAQLTALLLLSETTSEGETLRKPTPLKLVRDRTALFFLTFLAMHEIDESSPLYGSDAIERLDADGATIILSLNGTDETLAAPIHARHVYQMTDIVVGARFADVLQIDRDGRREIDYRKFDDVVPVEVTLAPAPPRDVAP